jgi:hypothetical protein
MPQDPRLWDIFKAEFQRAFTDTAREQNAYKKLGALKMIGGDLNTYIADFEKLAHCHMDSTKQSEQSTPCTCHHRPVAAGSKTATGCLC